MPSKQVVQVEIEVDNKHLIPKVNELREFLVAASEVFEIETGIPLRVVSVENVKPMPIGKKVWDKGSFTDIRI